MTDNAAPAGPAHDSPVHQGPAGSATVGRGPQARFDFLRPAEGGPATVRAAGDIDLTNVGQFQAALAQAAASSSDITADLTAVTYCDSATIRVLFLASRQARLTIRVGTEGAVTGTLLEVSGLDQVATVVTRD